MLISTSAFSQGDRAEKCLNEAKLKFPKSGEARDAYVAGCLEKAQGAAPTPAASPEAVTPSAPESSRPYQTRDTWYIGFTIYPAGNLTVKYDDEFELLKDFDKKSAAGFQFGGGATINSKLLVGGEIISFSQVKENDELDFDNSLTETATGIMGVATFFPMEKGFFVRGGLGLTSLTLQSDLEFDDGTEDSDSDSVRGYGILAGVGYAWWLGQSFNLTANLDILHQSYNEEIGNPDYDIKVKDLNAVMAGIGFQWY